MAEASRDTKRAIEAAKILIDSRDVATDFASILVTLDHLIALVSMNNNPRKAVGMLHEGTIPGVEERIALFASKGGSK